MDKKIPLNYKITAVSSQDQDHPALDLVEQLTEIRASGNPDAVVATNHPGW